MTIATGSRHSMAYVAETVYGTPPSTPVFKAIRHTGTTLGLSKDSIQSEEIRADRQISDLRHGNKSSSGDVNTELSYGSFDDFLEAGFGGTWTTDVLKAGVLRKSFTIERHFSDIGLYNRFTGSEINTIAISVAPNTMTTCTFGVMAQGMDVSETIITGATYTDPTTVSPFDSFTCTLLEGGVGLGVVTALDINLDNGEENTFVLCSDETLRPSIGRSNVTGSMTVYFEDQVLLEKFINETESSINLTIEDPEGNDYEILLPRIKYNSGQPDVTAEGPITLTMDFQALLDDTTGTNIQITRTAA